MSCLLFCVFIAPSCFGTIWSDLFFTKIAGLLGLTISISLDDSATAGGAWHFCVGRLLLLRSKSGPGGTLCHSGQCELAQRQAVLLRKDKSPIRAIKSGRAKVVMTAGCISKSFDIPNYIYNSKEIGNSANQNWYFPMFFAILGYPLQVLDKTSSPRLRWT